MHEGTVVLCLPAHLLKAVEALILLLHPGNQGLYIRIVLDIVLPGGHGHRGHRHVHKALQGYREEQGKKQNVVAPAPVLLHVEKETVQKHQTQAHVKGIPCKGIVIDQLLTEQDEQAADAQRHAQLLPRHGPSVQIDLIAHRQQQENIDEALPAGKAVGIMKAVPDEVQYVQGEAQIKEDQQRTVDRLPPQRNLPVHKVEGQHQEDHGAAVNVGPVVQSLLCLHQRHLSGQHVHNGEILLHGVRKAGICRSGSLQRTELRNQQNCRETSRQEGAKTEAQTGQSSRPPVHGLQHQLAEEPEHQEEADHDGNVVVGQDAEPQTEHVHHRALSPYEALQSQHHQREQEDAVQPHQVPGIGGHVAAHGIEHTEDGTADIQLTVMSSEIHGTGEAGETDLQNNHIGHELDDQCLRQQHHQEIQRTGQVVGIEGGEIDAQTHVPGIEKRSPVLQLVLKLRKEGGILMVHIRAEKGSAPAGIDTLRIKNHQHGHNRYQKSQKIGILRPQQLLLVHP